MNADAIVKALKCCNVPSGRACSECPYHEVGAECRTKRNKDAVELILELTEEIKDLEADYERVYEQAEADIRGNMADGGISCHWCMDKTKTDTVRMMREELNDTKIKIGNDYYIYANNVDVIAKEILEEKN